MKLSNIYNWCLNHRHPIFLVGLISFFIVPEIFRMVFEIRVPFPAILSLLVISSMLIMKSSNSNLFIRYGLIVALIVFLFIWNAHEDTPQVERAAYLFLFIYFSFISYYLFQDLWISKKITASVRIGAFAGYFMIGVIWFFIYGYLDNAFPETISVKLTSASGIEDMFYFSFITLTTIGYGDFAPLSSLGQKLAILEGLVGQFYIAIIMAILVGKYLSVKK